MKYLRILLLCALAFTVTSCDGPDFGDDFKIGFSELVNGSGSESNNSALEIYNYSSLDISLEDVSVVVYNTDSTIKQSIDLSGTLKSGDVFVLVSESSSSDVLAKADLVVDEREVFGVGIPFFSGSDPVRLIKDKTVCDTLGIMGSTYNYANERTFVRRINTYKQIEEINIFDYIDYGSNVYNLLGTSEPTITETEYLSGPKLTQEALSLPFAKNINNVAVGAGGAVKAYVTNYGDGDTTHFRYDDDLSEFGIANGDSIRYLDIDTPEVNGEHVVEQPWGKAASNFTNEKLKNAKGIYVMSALGGAVKEGYGRGLGYIFITDVENADLDDYYLLNFEIVKNGFSKAVINTTSANNNKYKEVPYSSYIVNAAHIAEENEIGVYTSDPSWDY